MGFKDWFKGAMHSILQAGSSIPGIGDYLNPLEACFTTDAQKKNANKARWLHQLALPVAAFFGASSAVYALMRMDQIGPTAAALTGPIIGGIFYIIVDAIACYIEGKAIPFCIIGDAASWSDSAFKNTLGIDPHFATKFVGEVESGALTAVFGKACAGA